MRVLIVEDSEEDTLLILRELEGIDCTIVHDRVDSKKAFLKALTGKAWDIILCDFSLPHFQGSQALQIVRERELDIPFIFVSGTIGEDVAVQAMKNGAHDYVMKGNLKRLLPAIERELRDAEERRQRREAEKSHRESEERYRLLSESSMMGVYLVQADRFLYVNPTFSDYCGYTREELLGGIHPFDLVHPADRSKVEESLGSIFDGTASSFHFVVRVIRKDSAILFLDAYGAGTFYDGKPAVIGTFLDITERQKAAQALEEAYRKRAELEFIINKSPAVVFLWRAAEGWPVEYVSESITQFGYSVEDLTSGRMTFSAMVFPDDLERIGQEVQQYTRNGLAEFQQEYRILTKGGAVRWIDDRTCLRRNRDGAVTHYQGIVTDITNRKRMEQALRESEERYRRFFEEDLAGDFVSTPEGKLLDCNPAFLRIFGFANREEALQTGLGTLYTNAASLRKLIQRVTTEKTLTHVEETMRHVNGTLIHAVENVAGVFDAGGNLVEIRGYLFDDTKRKQLEQQFIQAQKMESIGTLAGGIAHDFNNILGIILGYAAFLERNPKQQQQSIEAIKKATQRGAQLVRQILTFARKTEARFELVQINDLVGEVTKLLQETFPKNIELVLDLERTLPRILGDPSQMHQVLLNLAVNARDAMPGGGTLKISTRAIMAVHGQEVTCYGTERDSDYVLVSVQDTGTGMDEATRQRIFEPFFTTKEVGKGTGLGLAVVYGVLQSHGGHITVESSPGKGTTFQLYIPVSHQSQASGNAGPPTDAHNLGGTETILIIDDEQVLLELLESLLISKGYKVLTAHDGQEGVEVFERLRADIAVVLTDLGLPKLSGMEVLKRIRRLAPATPAIVASGYVDAIEPSELYTNKATAVIRKPYSPDEVLSAIRKVLAARVD